MIGNRKNRILKPFNLLRLLGIILFFYILSRVDLTEISHVLSKINISWFVLAILFQLILLFSKAVRWHVMNDGRSGWRHRLKSWGQFFESYAVGIATPGRLGEMIKAGHEEGKSGKATAILKMISERGFDVGIFLFFAALALVAGSFIEIESYWGYVLILISLSLISVAFILLTSGKSLLFLEKILARFQMFKQGFSFHHRRYSVKEILIIFLLSLAGALSHFISCYFLAQSVNLDIGLLAVAGGMAIAGMFNLLPVTIMGLGTRELTFLTLYAGYDHSNVMAFSFTILLVAQMGGGLVSLAIGHMLLYADKRNSRRST